MLKLSKYCKRNCSVSNGPVVGYCDRPQDHTVFTICASLGYHVSTAGAQRLAALLCASRIRSKGRLGTEDAPAQWGLGLVWLRTVLSPREQQHYCRQSPRDAEEVEVVVVVFEESPCRLWHLWLHAVASSSNKKLLSTYVAFASRQWFLAYPEIVNSSIVASATVGHNVNLGAAVSDRCVTAFL